MCEREMGKFPLAVVAAIIILAVQQLQAANDVEAAWQKYLSEFPIQTKSEYGIRKSLFEKTHIKIGNHNSKKEVSYRLVHNAFSVMTDEEKQQHLGAFKPVRPSHGVRRVSGRQLPTSLDHRTNDCMPAIRDQGSCGSCWAHSATAVVEFGKCAKYGGSSLDLSEQELVDCSRPAGCSGGWEHEAWQYLASNGGQTDEMSYPYTAQVGQCMSSPGNMPVAAQISSSNPAEWIAAKDTTAMMDVLASGRILSIYMQLPDSFFSYQIGVFTDTGCVTDKAHAMNVVGYGTLNEDDYWVVRNTWGTGWGVGGYILVKRGVDLCLIESYARTTNID